MDAMSERYGKHCAEIYGNELYADGEVAKFDANDAKFGANDAHV